MVDEAIDRWHNRGGSNALVWGRWALLHSASSWATAPWMIRPNPILVMRPPRHPDCLKCTQRRYADHPVAAPGDAVLPASGASITLRHEQSCDGCRGVVVHDREHVRVGLQRDRDVRVPETFLYDARVDVHL